MQIVLFDPGNYTPHYVENLGLALASLDARVELITSPPLFEEAEPLGSINALTLFFRFAGGNSRQFFRRHARLRRGLKVLSYPAGLWRTWRALKVRPPGILHVQWALMPVLDALLLSALRSRGWRIVYTAHDLLADLQCPGRRRGLRRLFRQIDAVVVHTRSLEQTLGADSGDVVREVRYIPEGISTFPLSPDADRTRSRRILGLDPDSPLLLFFGLIKPNKGLKYLLHAWPLVLAEVPQAQLLIAGESLQPLAPFERLIDRLHIRESVVLRPGYVPSAETQYFFCAADAVVLPYLQITTSGVVPLAYRYARPVIATAVGGLPEIVRDGETGFLAPPASEHALASAICRALRDLSLLADLGRRGHKWFAEEQSWGEVARRTLELYTSLPTPPRAH